MGKRTPIGAFIHSRWAALLSRTRPWAFKNPKNKCYSTIKVCFTRQQFKDWCLSQKEYILSLERPSLDRKNSELDYTLDNIQIIELSANIKKKRFGNTYTNGPKSGRLRGIKKMKNKWQARITINKKEINLGVYQTKEKAYKRFYDEYIKVYGRPPFNLDLIKKGFTSDSSGA